MLCLSWSDNSSLLSVILENVFECHKNGIYVKILGDKTLGKSMWKCPEWRKFGFFKGAKRSVYLERSEQEMRLSGKVKACHVEPCGP